MNEINQNTKDLLEKSTEELKITQQNIANLTDENNKLS